MSTGNGVLPRPKTGRLPCPARCCRRPRPEDARPPCPGAKQDARPPCPWTEGRSPTLPGSKARRSPKSTKPAAYPARPPRWTVDRGLRGPRRRPSTPPGTRPRARPTVGEIFISNKSGDAGLRSAARSYKATRQRTRPGRTTKSSAKDLSLRKVKLQSAGWGTRASASHPSPAC